MRTEEARLLQCGQLLPDCFSSEPIHHCGCMAGCSRLDCGTGPGLVRSRHRVQLRAWNHLAVFRHDWAVWLQLNRGRREEGRSQVRTLGWAGDAVSKSWFQITISQSFHSNSLRMLHFHCRPLIQSVLFMNIKPLDLRRDSSRGSPSTSRSMLAAWAASGTSAASWGWTPAWWATYHIY